MIPNCATHYESCTKAWAVGRTTLDGTRALGKQRGHIVLQQIKRSFFVNSTTVVFIHGLSPRAPTAIIYPIIRIQYLPSIRHPLREKEVRVNNKKKKKRNAPRRCWPPRSPQMITSEKKSGKRKARRKTKNDIFSGNSNKKQTRFIPIYLHLFLCLPSRGPRRPTMCPCFVSPARGLHYSQRRHRR